MQIPWILIVFGYNFGFSTEFASMKACRDAQAQIVQANKDAGMTGVGVRYTTCVSRGSTH